jgi:hypothetical protein
MPGENIMKFLKLTCAVLCIFFLTGCSENQEPEETEQIPVETEEQAAIRKLLIEYFDRVIAGDKTVMYENELVYYKDLISLSEYMDYPRVLDYKYDTLEAVSIDSIKVSGDSARAWVKVVYESAAGGTFERAYGLELYYSFERWRRPYLSRWDKELEYIDRIRAYDSAAAAEEAEK